MRQIHGCLFDMDGLLLDTERLGMAVFRDVMAGRGLSAADAEALYRSMVGVSLRGCQVLVQEALPGADMDAIDADWRAGIDAAMARGVPLRPTVRETLERLAARAVPMAVVTTTRTDRARHHLEDAGLLHHFVDVIGVDRVTDPKPAPEPYQKGANALGLLPGACAAFEDSDTGTRAAVTAGCQTWQIPDLRPEGLPVPEIGQTLAGSLADAVAGAGL